MHRPRVRAYRECEWKHRVRVDRLRRCRQVGLDRVGLLMEGETPGQRRNPRAPNTMKDMILRIGGLGRHGPTRPAALLGQAPSGVIITLTSSRCDSKPWSPLQGQGAQTFAA